MVVFPLFKLGALALRTLSKPIAGRLKHAAGVHPRFRQSIINIAQIMGCAETNNYYDFHNTVSLDPANHRLTTTMQRRIYGHATDVEIRPLNEERAVQAAADLIGELFIFSVAGAAIIFEVQRSSRSETKKEEERKQVIEELKQRDSELAKELELLRHKVEEFEQLPRGQGLAGIFKSRQSPGEDGKSQKPSPSDRKP